MFQLYSNGFRTVSSGIHADADQWYHVVGTYDGNIQKIFINGILQNSSSWNGTINIDSHSLMFGYKVAGDNNWLNGSLDDVRIYNYALNEDAIQVIYIEE